MRTVPRAGVRGRDGEGGTEEWIGKAMARLHAAAGLKRFSGPADRIVRAIHRSMQVER